MIELLLTVGLGDDLSLKILSFLPHPSNLDQYTTDWWFHLFLRCVRISYTDRVLIKSFTAASASLNPTHFRIDKTWMYALYSNEDVLYWWNKIKDDPVRSRHMTPELTRLLHKLTSKHPHIGHLSHLFIGRYDRPSHKLYSHRDKELTKYLLNYEHIICGFSGIPRILAFGPFHMFTKNPKSPGHLLFQVMCSSRITIEILPIGNKLFVHSKRPTKMTGTSTTFTFRRGIPVHIAKFLYPSVYKKAVTLL